MLYHFPDESPEDLIAKEGLSLASEIERASRVEKYGFSSREISLSSSYVLWRCMNDYLKCPVEKWTLPKSSTECIYLEQLDTEFLPPLTPYKPLTFYDPVSKEKIQRIVGFREILCKREYVEYLREIEMSDSEDDDEDDDPFDCVPCGTTQIDMSHLEEQSQAPPQCDRVYKAEQFLRIARGGGKSGEHAKDKEKHKSKGGKDKEKDKDHKKDKNKSKDKGAKGATKPGFFSKFFNFIKGIGKKKNKPEGPAAGTTTSKPKEKAAPPAKPPPPKDTKVKSTKWGVLSNAQQAQILEDKMIEAQNKQNLEKIFMFHKLFRVPATLERDSEWLELSDTDLEESANELQKFEKPFEKWMDPRISLESQNLVHTLKWFTWSLKLTGRSFLGVKPDYTKKHMDFRHKKRDLIFFFITTIMFWVAFCLIVTSFIDVQSQKSSGNDNEVKNPLIALTVKAETNYQLVEELELSKYQIPLFAVLVNLIFVAVWSILIILGDGILIAHYFNCWCAALAEMETSGTLKLKRHIISYHIYYVCYVTIMILLFYFNYPSHIRHSCGLIATLIMRPVYPNLRIRPDNILLHFQTVGLCIQLYVIYCAVMSKLLMQLLAIILKNASEMWNFKFALTFQQLAIKNRGQLFRMGLNHSLLKLFTHHRLLTVLLRNFGEVFSAPIVIYMVCEMGVITMTMVRMFFYKAGKPSDHQGLTSILIKSKDPSVNPTIEISYYHSPGEDYFIFGFVLFQMCTQFMSTTEVLASSGNAFFAGYEFVRRSGTMLCRNSHQRRLIQSLEWSFSSTDPSVLSANSYFAINRSAILGSFAAVIGFFSLIIQLQVDQEKTTIEFENDTATCSNLDNQLELFRGACVHKADVLRDATHLF